jgi:acid phosphatase family membrane protein YuiD
MSVTEVFEAIFLNKVVIFPLAAYFTAQVLKVIFRFIGYPSRREHPFFLESGGMPSAHAAVVTAVAVMVGHCEGVRSSVFGLAMIFAAIVVYDAIYVRGRADRQAKVLNKIVQLVPELRKSHLKRLKTQEGHTYLEVLAGIVWGAILTCFLLWIT